jgi:hypothetical protein
MDIVSGDHILRGNIHGDRSQANPQHLINSRDDEKKAGTFCTDQTAQSEDDSPLIFSEDLDRGSG